MENKLARIGIILILLSANRVWSQTIVNIINNKNFIVTNDFYKNGQRLLLYKDKKLMARAKVGICSRAKCRVKITKARKNFKLTKELNVRSKPYKWNKKKKKKKKKFNRPKESENKKDESQKEEEKPEDSQDKWNEVLASFGGPLLLEFRFAYRRYINKDFIVYGVYDYISTSLANVTLEGYGIGIGGEFHINAGIFAYLELGTISTSVDFSTANSEGPSFVANSVSYTNFGGTYLKPFSNSIKGLVRLGYAMNGFAETYDNDDDKSFTTPFAGGLLTFELGLVYAF